MISEIKANNKPKDLDDALKIIKKASELNQNSDSFWFTLGLAYII